jgi:hypothetical protein
MVAQRKEEPEQGEKDVCAGHQSPSWVEGLRAGPIDKAYVLGVEWSEQGKKGFFTPQLPGVSCQSPNGVMKMSKYGPTRMRCQGPSRMSRATGYGKGWHVMLEIELEQGEEDVHARWLNNVGCWSLQRTSMAQVWQGQQPNMGTKSHRKLRISMQERSQW